MLFLSLVAAQQTSSGRVHDQPGLPVKFSFEYGLPSQRSWKNNQGACRLARCQQRAQAQTYPWVGG